VKIESKAEFYQLWRAGALGNRPRAWATADEALASGAPRIAIRSSMAGRRWLGGAAVSIVRRDQLREALDLWAKANHGDYALDEPAPDALVTLQGEVCRGLRGWEGYFGVRTGLHMRVASMLGMLRPYSGVAVRTLLDCYLDPSSRDDVDALLEMYPDATIELAAYSVDVGIIPGRNTLIWEVRDY
jgi:hypothetical protein